MKTIRLIATTALLAVTATLTFAGPGPQFWQQRSSSPAKAQKQPGQAASRNQPGTKDVSARQAYDCQGCNACKAKRQA